MWLWCFAIGILAEESPTADICVEVSVIQATEFGTGQVFACMLWFFLVFHLDLVADRGAQRHLP